MTEVPSPYQATPPPLQIPRHVWDRRPELATSLRRQGVRFGVGADVVLVRPVNPAQTLESLLAASR